MSDDTSTEGVADRGNRGPIMFWIATLWLMNLSVLLHRHLQLEGAETALDIPESRLEQEASKHPTEMLILLGLGGLLHAAVIGDAFLRLGNRNPKGKLWKAILQTIWLCLLPAARISLRDERSNQYYWFPRFGWRTVDKDLRKSLERFFSVPMIVIALMVLPVLGIEVYWRSTLSGSVTLQTILIVANSIIWFAFAFELLVMLSAAHHKLRFFFSQWINVLIILLPLLSFLQKYAFLPLLRLFRMGNLLKLSQLARMGRIYRLRGVVMRVWRSVLVLGVLQRLFGGALEKRLENLETLLDAKQDEIEELKSEIQEVRERIAERDAEGQEVLAEWRAHAKTSYCSTTDSLQ